MNDVIRPKKYYLTDDIVDEKDHFEVHTDIAETVIDIIKKQSTVNSSFTLGLFGKWGSGKSFIIYKINEIIKNDKSIIFLNLDVWKYSGFPLLRCILFDINDQLKKLAEKDELLKEYKDGISDDGKLLTESLYCDEIYDREIFINSKEQIKNIKEYFCNNWRILLLSSMIVAAFIGIQYLPPNLKEVKIFSLANPILTGLTAFISFIGGLAFFSDWFKKPIQEIGQMLFFNHKIKNFHEKANFSPEQFENLFKKHIVDKLKKIGKKVVIVFDNIDRCEHRVAYETLSTIKTYMNCSDCFYIIPCDDDAIKHYLSNANGENQLDKFYRNFADEFIDKLFQTYIRIPVLKEVDRDSYIRSQFEELDFEHKIVTWEMDRIIQILYYAYKGETPRNIKRFINDYITYYRLAEKSIPELLNKIELFTIMVVIKQKWAGLEDLIIQNVGFFDDLDRTAQLIDICSLNECNKKELKTFFESIKGNLRAYSRVSLLPFIYFKKSSDDIEYLNKLREGNLEIELNTDSFNLIKKAFNKNILSGLDAYIINSFKVISALIVKHENDEWGIKLSSEFWKNIEQKVKSTHILFPELLNLKNNPLKFIIETLNHDSNYNNLKPVQEIIINYIYAPIDFYLNGTKEKDIEVDAEKIKLFKILIESYIALDEELIKKLFDQFIPTQEYYRSLLQTVVDANKLNLLHKNVISSVITNFDQVEKYSLSILEKIGQDKLSDGNLLEIITILTTRIKQRSTQYTPATIKTHIANIRIDLKLINLLRRDLTSVNTSFINVNNLQIQRMFESGDIEIQKEATLYWIEFVKFSKQNNMPEFYQLLTTYVAANEDLKTVLIQNIKYPEMYFYQPLLKTFIFQRKPFLSELYRIIPETNTSDFSLILTEPITVEDLNILIDEFGKRNDISFDKEPLIVHITDYFFTKLKENQMNEIEGCISFLDKHLNNKDDIIIKHKNIIYDFYIQQPDKGKIIILWAKKYIDDKKYNDEFIRPLLSYIETKLKDKVSVTEYKESHELLVDDDKQNKSIIFNLVNKLLEKGQELDENTLAINLLKRIQGLLSVDENTEIQSKIYENENKDNWLVEDKNYLETKGYKLQKEPDDSGKDDSIPPEHP